MKTKFTRTILSLTVLTLASCSEKAPSTSETAPPASKSAKESKEQEFLAKFRKAIENKDTKAMDSLLLKEGSPAEIVEFYQMMMEIPAETKIESIELTTPSAEEAAKYDQAMEMPDGKKYRLPIKPSRQLVMIMKESGANGSGTSKSSLPVAEKDGQLVIPMPVAAL